ncbi:MAG: hypothetical protein CL902_02785 [Dehalococcoidia bacterium]|nr:hypothetical protein [Dehalococcoidia bacterium]
MLSDKPQNVVARQSHSILNIENSVFLRIRGLAFLLLVGLVIAATGCQRVAQGSEDPAPSQQSAVQDFVRQTYIHGLPYAEAQSFTSSDIDILASMLENPVETAAWPNIVGTLGAIGDDEAFSPLIGFFITGSGVLTPSNYAAKTSVPMALGYLLNQTDTDSVYTQIIFNYLNSGLDPEVWSALGISWTSPFGLTSEEERDQLVVVSVMGLALSGTAQANSALREFQFSDLAQQQPFASLLSEAIEANNTIAEIGLVQYYQQSDFN